jgi:hypothetical protein
VITLDEWPESGVIIQVEPIDRSIDRFDFMLLENGIMAVFAIISFVSEQLCVY